MKASKTTLEAFERFWAAYPRRPDNPKAAAREVFVRRVREGADAEAVASAAGRYADACRKSGLDLKFVPHARTWLSQRRYEDFLEADVPASAPAKDASCEPSPDHPLAALREAIGDAAWRSWIQPLTVTQPESGGARIESRNRFALQRVERDYGALIEGVLGPVAWSVSGRNS